MRPKIDPTNTVIVRCRNCGPLWTGTYAEYTAKFKLELVPGVLSGVDLLYCKGCLSELLVTVQREKHNIPISAPYM